MEGAAHAFKCFHHLLTWFFFQHCFIQPSQPRNLCNGKEKTSPKDWLRKTIQLKEENDEDSCLAIPKHKTENGFEDYTLEMLHPDQLKVVLEVMGKIKEWMECDDLSKFQPLRLTVTGAGGTGKSVIINTLVTLLRKMFKCNGVIKVAAPTGVAAFNVGGETFFHLTNSRPTRQEYSPNAIKSRKEQRMKLVQKFQSLLALIVDERSLVSQKDIGTTSQLIAETIYGGGPFKDEIFGGLPVVVLFGDDHQLPPMEKGAFHTMSTEQQRTRV